MMTDRTVEAPVEQSAREKYLLPRNRKAVLFLVGAAGIVVMAITGIYLKRPLVEAWYLRQVESGTHEEKIVAIDKLAGMGSVRVVPHLLELILDAQLSETSSQPGSVLVMGYGVSDLLDSSSDLSVLSIGEALVDLVWEVTPSEGHRPRLDLNPTNRGDRLLVYQSRQGHDAVRGALRVVRQVQPTIERFGRDAIPELSDLLLAKDAPKVVKLFVEFEVRLLINALRSREDGPALVSVLERRNLAPAVRGPVLVALGDLGDKATAALPLLITALEDTDPHNRMYAADALGAIGPRARDALPALRTLLRDDEVHYVRRAAESAIGRIQKGHAASP